MSYIYGAPSKARNPVYTVYMRIFLLDILIFQGLTALRLYKSFGVKGLIR
jgi:hypothetical protein